MQNNYSIVRECAFYEFYEFYKIHKFLRILKHRTNFIIKFVFFKHIVYCVQSSRELNRVSKLAYKYMYMYDAMAAKPLRFRPAVAVVYESF